MLRDELLSMGKEGILTLLVLRSVCVIIPHFLIPNNSKNIRPDAERSEAEGSAG